ncbi:glycosyltransferase family 87 protein [Qipengyuania sp. SM2507]
MQVCNPAAPRYPHCLALVLRDWGRDGRTMAIEALREARWLHSGRVRAYALLWGFACAALLVSAYLEATGPTGSDFLAFWGAGQVSAAGNPASAYDLAVQQRVQTATGSLGWFAFVNPPPFLFAATPFGTLPYPLAWLAWVAITFAAWAWASIRAFPRLWPLVLVYPGALIAATHAQTGLLTGALLVFAATQLDRRPLASGAAIGALVIKPHLAVLLPFWLAAGRRWRVFVVAGASVVGLVLASWAVFGTRTMLAYPDSWQASAALMEVTRADFFLRMATLYSQLRLIAGEEVAVVAGVALALAMVGCALLAWRRFAGDAQGAAAAVLAATALAPPYLFNYDLPFLIVPTLWLVREGLACGFRPYEKLALVLLYFAPFATRALALPLELNLMPLASAVLLALVWSRGPASRSGEPERA